MISLVDRYYAFKCNNFNNLKIPGSKSDIFAQTCFFYKFLLIGNYKNGN